MRILVTSFYNVHITKPNNGPKSKFGQVTKVENVNLTAFSTFLYHIIYTIFYTAETLDIKDFILAGYNL